MKQQSNREIQIIIKVILRRLDDIIEAFTGIFLSHCRLEVSMTNMVSADRRIRSFPPSKFLNPESGPLIVEIATKCAGVTQY